VPAAPSDQKSEHKRSIFVEDDMAAPSPGSAEKKKARRSGTLRTILRGVFGRKRKTQSKELSPPPSRAGVKHEHSRSVSNHFSYTPFVPNRVCRTPSLHQESSILQFRNMLELSALTTHCKLFEKSSLRRETHALNLDKLQCSTCYHSP
jgi:hypothetical protein